MEKILLVTLWDNKNFGNRLQAFALKHMVEQSGYSTLCAVCENRRISTRIKTGVKIIVGFMGFSRFKKSYLVGIRTHTIKQFNKRYLEPGTKTIKNFNTTGIVDPNKFLAAVTGSDQVWHKWTKNERELPYFYLQFMPQDKRISYAASFGFEEIPEGDQTVHTKGLNAMHHISCREESGCRLVKQITQKPGKLVLDPTLCIDKAIWDSLEQEPAYPRQTRFVLLFMLGEKKGYINVIKDYAENRDLEIIDLFDISKKEVWKSTVNNFLWLVHHAEYIFTDSFHCTVFSIIYQRPFMVFQRSQKGFEHMFDRIDTLLRTLEIENCQYDGKPIAASCIHWGRVQEKLAHLAKESVDWIKFALKTVSSNS